MTNLRIDELNLKEAQLLKELSVKEQEKMVGGLGLPCALGAVALLALSLKGDERPRTREIKPEVRTREIKPEVK